MDLEGSTLIIPVGCTLDFQGGSFKNGVIEGNGTRIINSDNRYIFKDNLSTSGGFDIEELDIKWFGAKSDYSDGTGTDCSPAIERALEWSQYFYGIYIGIHGSFYLGTPIVTNKDLNLRGDRVPGKILFTEAAGNPNQNITSTIYVKPGIKAFTLKGFGDTAKLIKFNLEGIKFTSAWGISDDNTEWTGANTVLISSDTIGGPSRPGSIIGCTISNFYRVLELDSSKINKETQFYNLDIRRNSIDKCGTIFYSRTYGAQKGSGLITIENNILEQSVSVFDMSKIFGYIKICSNLLENSGNSSITLANPGNIDLIGNYWEAMHGNFSITGTDYSSVVRILQNSGGYIQASPSSQYRIILREVTLLDYDLYNMGDVTLRGVIHKVSPRIRLADIPVKTYINCAVHIPIQSVNFTNPSDTFKDPKYHYASRSYIENGAINEPLVKSAFIPNSTFQNVGSIKGKLNDFVYVSFYKNAGPLTIAIYTDGGIKAGYDIATGWESGYCFIVTKINQNVGSSDSNIYVVPYNTNTQMDVQISNVNIVNLTSASIYDYNIGDIVVTTNSNGSLTNKVIQVSDVNAINFLNNNLLTGYTLNIVKDIDLQGNSIKIPANCTLDFQGGSISNGILNLNNTELKGNVRLSVVTLTGSCNNNIVELNWFTDTGDQSTNLQSLVNVVRTQGIINIGVGKYLINNPVTITKALTLKGNNIKSYYVLNQSIYNSTLYTESDINIIIVDTGLVNIEGINFIGAATEKDPDTNLRIGTKALVRISSSINSTSNCSVSRCNFSTSHIGLEFERSGIAVISENNFTMCNCGLRMFSSGDSNLINNYFNTISSNVVFSDANASSMNGIGILLTASTGNTNIIGGKVEYCNKGIVVNSSMGVNINAVQFDWNKSGNLFFLASSYAIDGTIMGSNVTGCRFLGTPAKQHIYIRYWNVSKVNICGNFFTKNASDVAAIDTSTGTNEGPEYIMTIVQKQDGENYRKPITINFKGNSIYRCINLADIILTSQASDRASLVNILTDDTTLPCTGELRTIKNGIMDLKTYSETFSGITCNIKKSGNVIVLKFSGTATKTVVNKIITPDTFTTACYLAPLWQPGEPNDYTNFIQCRDINGILISITSGTKVDLYFTLLSTSLT